MAEADWDEVTYLRKKPQRAADAKSQKVTGLPEQFPRVFPIRAQYTTSTLHTSTSKHVKGM